MYSVSFDQSHGAPIRLPLIARVPFETHQLTRSIYFNVATILAIIFIRLPYDMLQRPFPHLRYNNILATTFWTLATRLHRQLM